MQMLGPQSMAAFLRAGLGLFSILLWIFFALLIALASGYAGAMVAIHAGWLNPANLHSDHVTITVNDAEKDILAWPAITAGFIGAFVAVPATMVIVRELKAMFDTFVLNDPFRAENGAHLRIIALALIVIQVSDFAQYYIELLLTLLFRRKDQHEVSLDFSLGGDTLTLWFLIAILFVLAAVFREGAKMRAEQNLTV